MMQQPTSDMINLPRWKQQFGITPGNPFAPFVTGSVTLFTVAIVAILSVMVFGTTATMRFNASVCLLFSGLSGSIVIMLLVIYARRYVRIQRIIAGDYLVRWKYPSHPRGYPGDEVYISHDGVYWSARRLQLLDFLYGLTDIELLPDELVFHCRDTRSGGSLIASFWYDLDRRIRVPIPAERRTEAAELVEQLLPLKGRPSDALMDAILISWNWFKIALAVVIVCGLMVFALADGSSAEQEALRLIEIAPTQEAEQMLLADAFGRVEQVIAPQLNALREAAPRTYTPESLGFTAADNVEQVITGFCRPEAALFYVMVIEKTATLPTFREREPVFHYTEGAWSASCSPLEWRTDGLERLDSDHWHYVYMIDGTGLATQLAELEHLLTRTPQP